MPCQPDFKAFASIGQVTIDPVAALLSRARGYRVSVICSWLSCQPHNCGGDARRPRVRIELLIDEINRSLQSGSDDLIES